jgi:hypothetical protein
MSEPERGKQRVKRLLTTLAVTGMLVVTCNDAFAKPAGGGGTTKPPSDGGTTKPTQSHPDPTGLMFVFVGATAVVVYVSQRKRVIT